MKFTEETMITHAKETNHNVKRAYWWMKGIDRDEAKRLGLNDQIQAVLSLLEKVDDITMDIVVTINQKQK